MRSVLAFRVGLREKRSPNVWHLFGRSGLLRWPEGEAFFKRMASIRQLGLRYLFGLVRRLVERLGYRERSSQ